MIDGCKEVSVLYIILVKEINTHADYYLFSYLRVIYTRVPTFIFISYSIKARFVLEQHKSISNWEIIVTFS